jgi:hypothetical protein
LFILFNRKERKETLRPLGILWELCGKKNKREVNIYFLLIEINKSILLQKTIKIGIKNLKMSD